MSNRSRKTVKQELMLGLIYPAVLGTIVFQLLESLAYVVRGQYPLNVFVTLKYALLIISIGFYVCDYLYIMFTRRYSGWFFFLDIVFLVLLYATIIAVDINDRKSLPHNKLILLFYVLFLLLYLRWDNHELHGLPEGDEREFYKSVVKWEKIFLIVFIVFECAFSFWNNHFAVSVITIILLSFVTTQFAFLVRRMRRFYEESKREPIFEGTESRAITMKKEK